MSNRARIEEVSDSDPEDMDPSDFDPADFDNSPLMPVNSLIKPANIPTSSSMPSHAGESMLQPQMRTPTSTQSAERERTKHWQCLYPIYFDATKTRAEGRRVGKEQSVPNPLAREIVDAVQGLGLSVVFEPGKCHPKDWSNPGRVRILLKEKGRQVARNVRNKHHLYDLVSEHLRTHPTTEASPMRLRIQGLPTPDKPIPAPAVPRGWKIGTILPLHSPALSGGGVSENFLQDMMAEIQGKAPGSIAGAQEVSGGKKKDKKRKAGG
ncbi:signal recognition particle subunit [Elasticomyces elasticus]|nr:signal recognition particle subunit [Elasticomyces elasticus]